MGLSDVSGGQAPEFRNMDAVRAGVLDILPASGEIRHQDLVAQLHQAGNHSAPENLLRFKREGAIQMRVVFQEDGSYELMVSRPGGA